MPIELNDFLKGRGTTQDRRYSERYRGTGRQYSCDTAARGAVLHGTAV